MRDGQYRLAFEPPAASHCWRLPGALCRHGLAHGHGDWGRQDPAPVYGSVNAAQAATFKSFFEETTAGGALPFDWVHPREGTSAEFRFVEAPRVSALTGTLFSVAVKLEQMP